MSPLQWALAGVGLFIIMSVFVVALGAMLGAAGAQTRPVGDEKR